MPSSTTHPEVWSVRKVISWITRDLEERGIESARLDAELLLAHALDKKRIDLYLDLEKPLTSDELFRVRGLIKRRRMREPIAYILGEREFFGRTFVVTPDVLIPRPDTETLVEASLSFLRQSSDQEPDSVSILDIGTGSGAIAVTLACEMPELHVDAVDISEAALAIARRNAENLGVASRVQLYHSDLTGALTEEIKYKAVISNPPYIAKAEIEGLEPDIHNFEPYLALDGGDDGLDYYRRLARKPPVFSNPAAPFP